MLHSEFSIGTEFWLGAKRWRCTDVGTRTVIAICLEPREIVRTELDPDNPARRVEIKCVSSDPRDLNGPPYGIVESVLDEYDLDACTTEPECTEPNQAETGPERDPERACR
jgi:hypothetical protein